MFSIIKTGVHLCNFFDKTSPILQPSVKQKKTKPRKYLRTKGNFGLGHGIVFLTILPLFGGGGGGEEYTNILPVFSTNSFGFDSLLFSSEGLYS